jgi:hypothetical protein
MLLPWRIWGLSVAVVCTLAPTMRAEVFHLANGGNVRGEVVNPDQSPRSHWVVKTAQGGQISLPAEQVKKIDKQSTAEVEYDRLAAVAPDTIKGQWDVAEFCHENRLPVQRTKHLERIIQLDSDHVEARRALGYSKVKGQWTTVDEGMDAQGRKRYKGAWRLPQEIELMERAHAEEQGQKDWHRKLKQWRGWFAGNKADLARQQIAEIRDPLAIKALAGFLADDQDREFRLLCIEALTQIGGSGLDPLVTASLADRDEELRIVCLEKLHAAHYKPALIRYIRTLRDKDNGLVNLAAVGLSYMDDSTTIAPLIDALVTSHKHVIQPGGPPGQMSAGFGSGPGGAGGGSFNFGSPQPQVITRDYQNSDVLRTLVALSGVNFDYDVSAWKRWYTSQKKSTAIDTRRDDR